MPPFLPTCVRGELCLPPCPVDCIDLVPIDRQLSEEQRIAEQHHLKERYHTHLNRVAEQMADATLDKPVVSVVQAEATLFITKLRFLKMMRSLPLSQQNCVPKSKMRKNILPFRIILRSVLNYKPFNAA